MRHPVEGSDHFEEAKTKFIFKLYKFIGILGIIIDGELEFTRERIFVPNYVLRSGLKR